MTPKTLPGKTERSMLTQRDHDPAVEFGYPSRDNELKAYPFFYNFTKYPYQEGIANDSTGIYTITNDMAEGPDGITIPNSGILNMPIVMNDDTNFHLLYIKYGAFMVSEFSAQGGSEDFIVQPSIYRLTNGVRVRFTNLPASETVLNTITVYYVVLSSVTDFSVSLTNGGAAVEKNGDGTYTFVVVDIAAGSREHLLYPANAGLLTASQNTRMPYWTYLDVSVYFASSGARDLYGGFQRDPILGATQESPIPILDLQGSQDGLGMIKTPYQLTKSATVNIRFKYRGPASGAPDRPLRVYGHLFGYKITI